MGREADGGRRGATLIEFTIATTILAFVVLATLQLLQHDADISRATMGIARAETQAQEMLRQLEDELAHARGATPSTTLTTAVGPSESLALEVTNTLGFPSQGIVVVDRGLPYEERIAYQRFGAGDPEFRFLDRGELCTGAYFHPLGSEVTWIGLAEPLLIQEPPPAADLWDGISLEPSGPVFFRGDGVGFSYRLPIDTDPAPGPPNYMDGTEVQWGAELNGAPNPDAWIAIYFRPATVMTEVEANEDLNHDGDLQDAFDIGQLRKRTWDASDPNAQAEDIGIGPRSIIQERCNWGSDLDADGFDDPLFLWDERTKRLHVRLFLVGESVEDMPVVRRVESLIFLRNDPRG